MKTASVAVFFRQLSFQTKLFLVKELQDFSVLKPVPNVHWVQNFGYRPWAH